MPGTVGKGRSKDVTLMLSKNTSRDISLSDDCNCHGREGRLDAWYCSDVGIREDTARRKSKRLNVRKHAERNMMRRDDANTETFEVERLLKYEAAVRHLVESAVALDGGVDPDCLYLVIRVDRKNPRGNGILTTVQRDLTDPTGGSHRTSVSRYPNWEVCLSVVDGLMEDDTV